METLTIKQRNLYNGQIYDAYSLIIDIIKKAKKRRSRNNDISYHLGTLIKDLGKKCFGIDKIIYSLPLKKI